MTYTVEQQARKVISWPKMKAKFALSKYKKNSPSNYKALVTKIRDILENEK